MPLSTATAFPGPPLAMKPRSSPTPSATSMLPGRHRLLLLHRPAEDERLDRQSLRGEEPALHSEIEQIEGGGLWHGLADP
jgi:hypothetical protein